MGRWILLGTAVILYAVFFIKAFYLKSRGVNVNGMTEGTKVKKAPASQYATAVTGLLIVPIAAISLIFDVSLRITALEISGCVISLLGIFIFIKAVWDMRNSWRVGIPQECDSKLVTAGIYRYSRNPAYVGFDLLYIGITVGSFNVLLAAVTVSYVISLHFQILGEEKFLEKSFGESYKIYKNRTSRYFGINGGKTND